MRIALLVEHPTWYNNLASAFQQRGIEPIILKVAELSWDCTDTEPGFDLVINRVNAMPSAGRPDAIAPHTQHYLNWLEQCGVTVINGARTHFIGCSKAAQSALFGSLGLHTPRSIAIYQPEQAMEAAADIGFPCVVKPNIGGSGSGISRFHAADELELAVRTRQIDLGIDGTGLVQQNIRSADGYVHRIEVLGDALFYAIRQPIQEGSFNYCAADGCSTGTDSADSETRIETFQPNDENLEQAIACIKAADADLGGVEYLVDSATGEACFYDFNPYSNFVADGETLLGFSPEQRFIDFVLQCAGQN